MMSISCNGESIYLANRQPQTMLKASYVAFVTRCCGTKACNIVWIVLVTISILIDC
jgi:hypothetical protein